MSLSDELRDELASIAPPRRCCRLAELSALCHAAGTWHLHGHGELSVHLDLQSPSAARRAFALLRDLGVTSEIRTYPRHAFDRATRYQLHVDVDPAAAEVFREAGVLSPTGAPLSAPPKRVVGRSCCRGAYLRGALLGAGSLSGPQVAASRAPRDRPGRAHAIVAAAAGEGIPLKTIERRTHTAAYAKSGETIADLLAVAGASETALRLDEHAVVAATRSEANRLANADEANVKRTVARRSAAARGDPAARPRPAPGEAPRDRRPAREAPGAVADRPRRALPAADHQGGRAPPDGRARAPCGRRRRGSSEDELPPCHPHSDR